MYIVPSTEIYLLKGVPLDPTYDHTLYFETSGIQHAYFATKVKYSFTNQYYARSDTGKVRIQEKVENLLDCNYMMFRNNRTVLVNNVPTNVGKWFYCFISNPIYINENVTEISYSIDNMQTWFFDYELEECFVLREHTATDVTGDNLLPEPINNGELQAFEINTAADFHTAQKCVVILTPYHVNLQYASIAGADPKWIATLSDGEGEFINGIYSGVQAYFVGFNQGDQGTLLDKVNAVITAHTWDNKEGSIVGIYTLPETFVYGDPNAVDNHNATAASPAYFTARIPKNTAMNWSYTFNGKTGPRNKKLNTYPYTYLTCVGGMGKECKYKAEYFPNNNMDFKVELLMAGVPEARLTPKQYKGLALNYNESITLTDFPQNAYVIDTYKAWAAKNKAPTIIGIAGAGANVAAEAALIAAAGVFPAAGFVDAAGQLTRAGFANMTRGAIIGVNSFEQIAQGIATLKIASTLGDQIQGQNTLLTDIADNTIGFKFYRWTPVPQFAAVIDDFFDRLGYAVNAIKVPNRHVRENWTYTKTADCTIKGTTGLPQEAADTICSIYNRGITFWQGFANGTDHVGDYSLSNRPLSELT